MLFEIVNPSDPYVLEADDPNVAMVACLVLGEGAYGLTDENGEDPGLPLFLFGGDPDAWARKKLGVGLGEFVDARGLEVCAALESLHIGRIDEEQALRDTLAELPEEARATFLAKRHERRRSSLNDIGGRALALAKSYRARLERNS